MIPMVDNLSRQEIPADLLLHHKTMLADIAMAIGGRMIGPKHKPVFSLMEEATAAPSRVRFARRRTL